MVVTGSSSPSSNSFMGIKSPPIEEIEGDEGKKRKDGGIKCQTADRRTVR